MVTNLPAEARAQWRRVMEAKTPEEKLEELRKFYSLIPKHKGTKNLVRMVRSQMAKLREEIEESKKRKRGGYVSPWDFEKTGDVTVAIVSNSYDTLTKFLDYTYNLPQKYLHWRMLPTIYGKIFNDVEIQFVVAPPLGINSSTDYKIINICRKADYTLGLGESLEDLTSIKEILDRYGIYLTPRRIDVKLEKTPSGGIRVVGMDSEDVETVRDILRGYGIYNAVVKVYGPVDVELFQEIVMGIKTFIIGDYYLLTDGGIVDLSTGRSWSLDDIGSFIISAKKLIRVYPVRDIKEAPGRPLILDSGATVQDLARKIHSKVAENIRYALVKRNGEVLRVSPSYKLEDGDIVFIRSR